MQAAVRAFYRYLQRQGWFEVTPIPSALAFAVKKPAPLPCFLGRSEGGRLLAVLWLNRYGGVTTSPFHASSLLIGIAQLQRPAPADSSCRAAIMVTRDPVPCSGQRLQSERFQIPGWPVSVGKVIALYSLTHYNISGSRIPVG